MKFRVLFLSIVASSMLATASVPPDTVLENYCAAARSQENVVKSAASMEVEIAASLPKLKKQGRLHALRRITALGRITYEALRFEGDNTVKNQVIARYLTAEVEAQKQQAPSMAITPENYKFKYKGRDDLAGREVHVFQVTPRKKRPGLFKGEIWIDAETSLRVQESGYLVKNPSIFLKKVAFVRRYEIRDGISVPREMESVVHTRLVGKAELKVEFSHFSIDSPKLGDNEGQ